jgi:hypothetical protein
MLYYDVLDEVADTIIPNSIHPMLHINSKDAWVQIMVELIEHKAIKSDYKTLCQYAELWEDILYKRYSTVN